MARLDHLPLRCRAGIRVAAACVAIACLAATGCSAAVPERPPADAMQDDIATAFDNAYGEGAVRAIIVQQHGEPVYEQYIDSTADDTWDVRGIARAVTSTLIGIAIDRGLIRGVDATLGELLPGSAAVLTPETAAIPLRAALTHTAGFPGPPYGADLETASDWIAAILQDRAARGPGDGSFDSSDVGAHVLAAVVAQATGQSPLQFARDVLFTPLGIDADPLWEERLGPGAEVGAVQQSFEEAGVAWLADPQGINLGYTHLRLHPRDLLRIGQLFLREGAWEGEQVVSPSWAVEATTPVVASPGYGTISYGYQWWVDSPRGVFFAAGPGTTVVVDRRADAVAVIASDVTIDDEFANRALTSATVVELAIALIGDLPDTG